MTDALAPELAPELLARILEVMPCGIQAKDPHQDLRYYFETALEQLLLENSKRGKKARKSHRLASKHPDIAPSGFSASQLQFGLSVQGSPRSGRL